MALVVDPKRGTISGGGWHAYWKDEGPDNGPLTEQVLAWLVTSRGRATPITVDAHNHVDDPGSADRLSPPGEK